MPLSNLSSVPVLFLVLLLGLIIDTTWGSGGGGAHADNIATTASTRPSSRTDFKVLVVGSINADTFLPVVRLPLEGENLTLRPHCRASVDIPGGKGCTQAVAAKKLMQQQQETSGFVHDHAKKKKVHHKIHSAQITKNNVLFVGQFGNDAAAKLLQQTLMDVNVDVTHCGHHETIESGRGYVFVTESGSVSAVVSGGSNEHGWHAWEQLWNQRQEKKEQQQRIHDGDGDAAETGQNEVEQLLSVIFDSGMSSNADDTTSSIACVMLQREVPEYVNMLIATEAKRRNILVIQDIGGEDRHMSRSMMELCDYIIPNETELHRLYTTIVAESSSSPTTTSTVELTTSDDEEDIVLDQARALQSLGGAQNVLVTRGRKGCVLLTNDGQVLHQPACHLQDDLVVDETGAGDCFRAAFCVALAVERQPLRDCLLFASAAGACAVTKQGAVPAIPSRQEVDQMMILNIPRGGGAAAASSDDEDDINRNKENDYAFPFLFGSRLNSMKDRPELYDGPLNDPSDYVKRQAKIQGLSCVDFNFPQHFEDKWTAKQAKQALLDAGLVAGAVCLRYPSKFARGAMNHPDESMRREAIQLTKDAAKAAQELGCSEVVVWSAYDGYDYPFQVNYNEKWNQLVDAFRECCDEFPDLKFSVEYKPTDENTRFFTIPSTGAALLMVKDVNRSNFGLTLDVGHMLMSGENPAQSIAMVGGEKLFGIQLNDGYTRLAAEDGLMFGSVHPSMALEIMYQLRRIHFAGHFYFDTFPQRTDPIKEAEYNIQRVKQFWAAVERLDESTVAKIAAEHDALGALALVEAALKSL